MEAYIKHDKYYIQETTSINSPYQYYQVKDKYQSNDEGTCNLGSLDSAIKFIDEVNLNRASCIIEVDTEHHNAKGSWIETVHYQTCPVCNDYYAIDTLIPSVLDIETGIELLCEECNASSDLIVGNQLLDLEVNYEMS